ncbi:viral methyltransferase [Ostertagia ostertagi]
MRRLHYSRAAVENNYGYDSLICDIGGDVAYHVLENNVGVHCDCPALDQRDSVRFYSKISRLRSFIVEHDNDPFVSSKDKAVIDMCRVVVRAANDKCVDTDVFCRKKAQDCMRTARFGMLIHSNYDISLKNLADIMSHKNMEMLMGTFIFIPEMLIAPTGRVSALGARYVIDSDADTITFMFEGCSSFNYVHKFSRFVSYVTEHVVYDSDHKRPYLLELLENRGGVQYFKLNRVFDDFRPEKLQHCLWLDSLKDKYVVRFHRIDYDSLATRSKRNTMPMISCVADTKLVGRIMSQAMMQSENKFKPLEIFAYIHACGRIFMGSDIVLRHEPLTHDQNLILSFSIYIEVYKQKFDFGLRNPWQCAMPKGRRLSSTEQSRILSLHRAGHSKKAIAEQLGRSRPCIDGFAKNPTAYGKAHGGGRLRKLTQKDR